MSRKPTDLIGKQFGRLTVIKRGIKLKNGKPDSWYCKCACGNEELVDVRTRHLKSGGIKSCGCLRKETSADRNKKYNTYIEKNNFL